MAIIKEKIDKDREKNTSSIDGSVNLSSLTKLKRAGAVLSLKIFA